MNGNEVKALIRDAGLKCWQVAYAWPMNDGNFSRKLREPFDEADVAKLNEIIAELRTKKGASR